MLRGESVANPPLILLHGGPGLSETGFFRHFNAPLEKSFTVVYWDQRGAGKSFDRNIPRSSMTVEQFISDLDELVDAVRKRLGKIGRSRDLAVERPAGAALIPVDDGEALFERRIEVAEEAVSLSPGPPCSRINGGLATLSPRSITH